MIKPALICRRRVDDDALALDDSTAKGRSGSLQGPASPPTRGSRWMTAGLVQDAALDTGTVARVDTKPFTQLPGSARLLCMCRSTLLAPRGTR